MKVSLFYYYSGTGHKILEIRQAFLCLVSDTLCLKPRLNHYFSAS